MIPDETFNPRVIISNHYDSIINKIDLNAETHFHESLNKPTFNEADILIKNETREKQIEKIKTIQQKYLYQWVNFEKASYEGKWAHLIYDSSLDYEQKLEIIKEELILSDFVLIEENSRIIVWIFPFYVSEANSQFMR